MPKSSLFMPDDLREFLRIDQTLEYDPSQCACGQVTLLRPRQLRLRPFTIFTDEMQAVYGDPHHGKGCYLVPAVNLVATCEQYRPYGLLVWLPKERMFATWDDDHHIKKVLTARHRRGDSAFIEAATWSDTLAEPARYLSAQWGRDHTIARLLIPWPRYRWVSRH